MQNAEYKILRKSASSVLGTKVESTLEELENEVNAMIAEGWRPLGSISVVTTPGSKEVFFLQSLLKETAG